MNFNIRNRFLIFGIIFLGLFSVLFIQLIKLTLVKGADYAAEAGALKERTITVSGARGSILDRNGLPLAYDQKSYDVQFYRDPTKNTAAYRAYYTEIIKNTIKIIEENGEKTIDTFTIKYNSETGEYYFDWGDITPEAQKAREENWRENMYVGTEKTPEQIYLYLRDKYQIPSEIGYDEARKILSIWQDVQLASWVAYEPVSIAYNISIQTVAEIETHRAELTGMSIAESTSRVYPRGTLAAHIIGYMGRISSEMSEEQKEALENKGYSLDDLIGVAGVEQTMEDYLTGNTTDRQGIEEVEVDSMAVVKNILSSTDPKQGDNVVLTIDVPLQQAVEESLAKNIPEIKNKQIEQYNKYKDVEKPFGKKAYKGIDLDDIDLAESGAAVVIDVETGDVLAIASYPTFDPNFFIQGMTDEEYKELGFDDDELAPLLNKAVSSRGTPGSIFKMVTGLGALMEYQADPSRGVTLDTRIDDEGAYDKYTLYGKSPRCWVSNPAKHANQNMVLALQNSCDYYFYTLADKLGIDLLKKWGEKYGLTSSTGIELPSEAIGQIGGQKVLYDNSKDVNNQSSFIPKLIKEGNNGLINLLKGFAEQRGVDYSDEVISKTADDLLYIAGIEWTKDDNKVWRDVSGKSMGQYVRDILLEDMNIRNQVASANGWDATITSLLTELIWTPIKTVNTGIGQGYVQVTPIAVARYVAAIVNGGTVYQTHIVDKIVDQSGEVVFDQQPEVFGTLDAPSEYLDALKEGMQAVVSAEDGTASDYFKGWEYRDDIAGKTGTAQVSNIDLEDNSWFVCFAPYDKDDDTVEPEIAVVVYVPHGLSGGKSTSVAKDILQFYLDRKKIVAEQTIPDSDSIVDVESTDDDASATDGTD